MWPQLKALCFCSGCPWFESLGITPDQFTMCLPESGVKQQLRRQITAGRGAVTHVCLVGAASVTITPAVIITPACNLHQLDAKWVNGHLPNTVRPCASSTRPALWCSRWFASSTFPLTSNSFFKLPLRSTLSCWHHHFSLPHLYDFFIFFSVLYMVCQYFKFLLCWY